jgi:N-acetyl-anhydromuramyl-L-alanine amidase AmpD
MIRYTGVVIHGTRSGNAGNPTEGIGTVNYCTTPGTTSYNWIIDYDGTIYELIDINNSAWHAGYLNRTHLGAALAQPTVHDRITDQQHSSLKWLLREINRQKGIPLVHVTDENYRGLIEHREAQQGRASGKSDVGYQLDWGRII